MYAGDFNRRITIQQKQAGVDAIGQPVETWSDVAAVWAALRHASGLSTIKSDADTSLVKASIRIRWRTGLDAGMRVNYGGTIYQIDAVLPDLKGKQFVDLICVKVN